MIQNFQGSQILTAEIAVKKTLHKNLVLVVKKSTVIFFLNNGQMVRSQKLVLKRVEFGPKLFDDKNFEK